MSSIWTNSKVNFPPSFHWTLRSSRKLITSSLKLSSALGFFFPLFFLLSVTVALFEIFFCWLFPWPGLSKYGAPEICSVLYALLDDMAYPLGFNTTFQYANILFYMVFLITDNTNN